MAKRRRESVDTDGDMNAFGVHARRGPGQRPLRVGAAVREQISAIMLRGELHDPALQGGVVTVTEARVAPDLRTVTVFVMPLGGRNAPAVLAALGRAAPWLRGEIARRLHLKFAPALTFRLDDSFDVADRIESVLRRPEVQADLKPGRKAADET